MNRPSTVKELAKFPFGTQVLYKQNPDSSKAKGPTWCKGTIKDRKEPRKYEILTDTDRVVTRSRHHIKRYLHAQKGLAKP